MNLSRNSFRNSTPWRNLSFEKFRSKLDPPQRNPGDGYTLQHAAHTCSQHSTSSLCCRAAHPTISRPSVEGFPSSPLLALPGSRAILCGATDHFRMRGVWCTGLRQSEPCEGPRPLVDKASHSRPAPDSARAFGPGLCAHCGHATFGRPSGGRETASGPTFLSCYLPENLIFARAA